MVFWISIVNDNKIVFAFQVVYFFAFFVLNSMAVEGDLAVPGGLKGRKILVEFGELAANLLFKVLVRFAGRQGDVAIGESFDEVVEGQFASIVRKRRFPVFGSPFVSILDFLFSFELSIPHGHGVVLVWAQIAESNIDARYHFDAGVLQSHPGGPAIVAPPARHWHGSRKFAVLFRRVAEGTLNVGIIAGAFRDDLGFLMLSSTTLLWGAIKTPWHHLKTKVVPEGIEPVPIEHVGPNVGHPMGPGPEGTVNTGIIVGSFRDDFWFGFLELVGHELVGGHPVAGSGKKVESLGEDVGDSVSEDVGIWDGNFPRRNSLVLPGGDLEVDVTDKFVRGHQEKRGR